MNTAKETRLVLAIVFACLVSLASPSYAGDGESDAIEAKTPANGADHTSSGVRVRGLFQNLSSRSLEKAFQRQPQMPPDWQARYDRAVEKRSAAHTKDWLGAALIGGGVLLSNVSVGNTATCVYRYGDCSNSPALAQMYAALGLVSGGVVIGLWGLTQGISANSELSGLEQERSRAGRGTALRVPVGDNSSLLVAVTQKGTQVNYSVAW